MFQVFPGCCYFRPINKFLGAELRASHDIVCAHGRAGPRETLLRDLAKIAKLNAIAEAIAPLRAAQLPGVEDAVCRALKNLGLVLTTGFFVLYS